MTLECIAVFVVGVMVVVVVIIVDVVVVVVVAVVVVETDIELVFEGVCIRVGEAAIHKSA